MKSFYSTPLMKSFFAFALVLCRVCDAQCNEKPARDFEFYSLYDSTCNFGLIHAKRGVYGEVIQAVVDWHEENGFTAKGSVGRVNTQQIAKCYLHDKTRVPAKEALASITGASLVHTGVFNDLTYLTAIVWARQSVWTDAVVSDSVRRVFIVITAGYPADQPTPPNGAYVEFSDQALANSLQADCPLQYWPPAAQVGEALKGSKAGLLWLVDARYGSTTAQLWREYFMGEGVIDMIIPDALSNGSGDQLREIMEPALFEIACPSFVPPTYTTTRAPQSNEYCDQKPVSDFEFFSVLDASYKSGNVIGERISFANGIQAVAQWYEAGGFNVKGSGARAMHHSAAICYRQDSLQVSSGAAVASIQNSPLIYLTWDNTATYLAGVAWVRQAVWTDAYISDSVRRIVIIVTHGYPDNQPTPPNGAYLEFSEQSLTSTMQADCKSEYWPPVAQVADSLKGAKSGLLLVSYPYYYSQRHYATLWREYFAQGDITDLLVAERPAERGYLRDLTESALFEMVCPPRVETTAAPILFEKKVISTCIRETVPCDPCKTDEEEWKMTFEGCVRSASMASDVN